MAIVFLTIAAGGVLADLNAARWKDILIAAVAGALIVGGGNALNDCFDLEIDRLNRPDRPLPSGAITLGQARVLWIFASLFGIILSLLLTPWNMAVAVFWVVTLYSYSRDLKRTVLFGNLMIGVLTGMAFLFGALVAGQPSKALFPGVFAFLANVAREVLKDVEDVEGDRRAGALTLPVRYGTKRGFVAASVAIALLIATTFLPYALNIYNARYLGIVLAVDAVLLYVIVSWRNDSSRSNLNRLSGILKLAMVGGLVAIFAGS
jgi:geranylgeranylglycerol-phosphate geranylgeranyltransferase